jgi:hypothetical protein
MIAGGAESTSEQGKLPAGLSITINVIDEVKSILNPHYVVTELDEDRILSFKQRQRSLVGWMMIHKYRVQMTMRPGSAK